MGREGDGEGGRDGARRAMRMKGEGRIIWYYRPPPPHTHTLPIIDTILSSLQCKSDTVYRPTDTKGHNYLQLGEQGEGGRGRGRGEGKGGGRGGGDRRGRGRERGEGWERKGREEGVEREGAGEGGRVEGGFHWCKLCLVGYFTSLFLSTVALKRRSIIHPKTLYNVIIDTVLFWPAKDRQYI